MEKSKRRRKRKSDPAASPKPAPGHLRIVQDFLNTQDVDAQTDVLSSPEETRYLRVLLRVSEAARARLAGWGWHPTRGARPLKRVIEERVMTPVAVRLAGDPSFRGRTIWVVASADEAAPALDVETLVLDSAPVVS